MKFWERRRRQRYCLHHDTGGNPANTHPAVSWIEQRLIDAGRRKMLWCRTCLKHWFI